MPRPPLLVAGLAAAALVLTGCGGDATTPATPDDATTSTSASSAPSPAVTTEATTSPTPESSATAAPESSATAAPADDLATLEAYWMCDVQRFAFDDLDALQGELDARLESAGFTAEDYDEFRGRLEAETGLRQQVLADYQAYCDDADSAEG